MSFILVLRTRTSGTVPLTNGLHGLAAAQHAVMGSDDELVFRTEKLKVKPKLAKINLVSNGQIGPAVVLVAEVVHV